MDNFMEIFIPVGIVLFCVLLILWVVTFSTYKYDIEIARANIVEAFIGDTKVYEGKQAFININSGGMTTTLTIYKKLYPFPIIKETYSSDNIVIKPLK